MPSSPNDPTELLESLMEQVLRSVEEKLVLQLARLESISVSTFKEEFATIKEDILSDLQKHISASQKSK